MMAEEVLLEVWIAGLFSISPPEKVLPLGWWAQAEAGDEGEGGLLSCVA